VCDALAETGHLVVVLDVAASRAQATAARIVGRGERAVAVACDVSREHDVERALEALAAGAGPPSVLVHAAGVGGPFHRADEVSVAEWDHVFDTNLKSAFLFARRVLPAMASARFGRIVHVASIQGLAGARLSSTYAASKHGLVGYTRALAAEWGEHGITCNAVCPGYVDTPMGVQPEARPGHREAILLRTPSRRVAAPADVAAVVRFLVSDAARHVNGAAVPVDGGILADVGI
jgi:3-oxoacyl-[acyl-carrier protein] reductase